MTRISLEQLAAKLGTKLEVNRTELCLELDEQQATHMQTILNAHKRVSVLSECWSWGSARWIYIANAGRDAFILSDDQVFDLSTFINSDSLTVNLTSHHFREDQQPGEQTCKFEDVVTNSKLAIAARLGTSKARWHNIPAFLYTLETDKTFEVIVLGDVSKCTPAAKDALYFVYCQLNPIQQITMLRKIPELVELDELVKTYG